MIDPWRFARCFLLAILAVFWDGFGSSAPTAAVVVGTLPSFTVATSLAPKYGYDVMERSASTLNLTHRGVELLIASDPGVAGVRRDDAPGRVTTSQELMATKPGTAADDPASWGGEFVDDALRSPATRPDFGNISSKIQKQMQTRGWTQSSIDEAVLGGNKFPAVNKLGGANSPATRYVHPKTGQSVVIDNTTGEIIQVGGPGFKY